MEKLTEAVKALEKDFFYLYQDEKGRNRVNRVIISVLSTALLLMTLLASYLIYFISCCDFVKTPCDFIKTQNALIDGGSDGTVTFGDGSGVSLDGDICFGDH